MNDSKAVRSIIRRTNELSCSIKKTLLSNYAVAR